MTPFQRLQLVGELRYRNQILLQAALDAENANVSSDPLRVDRYGVLHELLTAEEARLHDAVMPKLTHKQQRV